MLGTTIVTATTFGVVARQADLDPLAIVAMSVFVFAGASQFAAVQLLVAGTDAIAIVGAVLFINLRHALMAASLRRQFASVPLLGRLAAAFVLTDESFAMATGYQRRGGRGVTYYATFAVSLYVLWVLGTIAGIAIGGAIGEPRRLGIDFAITATFIGIVVLAVRGRTDVAVAVVAAGVAGALAVAGATTIAVIVAGALAPLIAVARAR